jgi:hypothetical protein
MGVEKINKLVYQQTLIKIEEYPYNQTIVEKIKRGEKAIKEGKGIPIHFEVL